MLNEKTQLGLTAGKSRTLRWHCWRPETDSRQDVLRTITWQLGKTERSKETEWDGISESGDMLESIWNYTANGTLGCVL